MTAQELMQKAFKVCAVVFYISLSILVASVFSSVAFPDKVLNDPTQSVPFISPLVKALQVSGQMDFIITLFSGIAYGLTWLGKKYL